MFPNIWSMPTFSCSDGAGGTLEVWHIWCNCSGYLCVCTCTGIILVPLVLVDAHIVVSSSGGITCGVLLGVRWYIVPERCLLVAIVTTLDLVVVIGGLWYLFSTTLDSVVVVYGTSIGPTLCSVVI